MAFKTRGRRGGVHDWLVETAPDVPRSDLPKPFLGGRVRLRWVRAAVGVSVFLVPLLAISLMVTLVNRQSTTPPATATVSATQPAATAGVLTWLRASPSPVPGGGQILTWDGERPLPQVSAAPGQPVPPALAAHTFTVLAGTGQLFKVSTVTATSPEVGTVTIGDPALVPLPPASSDGADPEPWPTLEATSPTPNVVTAVNAWANAYTSGDAGTLLQATGDPDITHSYMPLAGAAFTGVSVTRAGAVWGEGKHTPESEPPAMVVRVDTGIHWLGGDEKQPPADLTDEQASPVSFDVLVVDADTASPTVVAWGAAGSGELLTPYQNAIVGRQLVVASANPTNTPVSPAPARTVARSASKSKAGGS